MDRTGDHAALQDRVELKPELEGRRKGLPAVLAAAAPKQVHDDREAVPPQAGAPDARVQPEPEPAGKRRHPIDPAGPDQQAVRVNLLDFFLFRLAVIWLLTRALRIYSEITRGDNTIRE